MWRIRKIYCVACEGLENTYCVACEELENTVWHVKD